MWTALSQAVCLLDSPLLERSDDLSNYNEILDEFNDGSNPTETSGVICP